MLVFAAPISLVSGAVAQTAAFYFVPPPGVDDEQARQLRILVTYIDVQLQADMPDEIDSTEVVGEEQVGNAQGLENYITANPQIQYLVRLDGITRVSDTAPWVFKCHRYQKEVEGTDRAPDLQKCRPFKQKIATLNNFEDVENFAKLVAVSVFPPAAAESTQTSSDKAELLQTSGDRIVFTTCFRIKSSVESRNLVKMLRDEVVEIPQKLAWQMGTLMKGNGYKFHGLSPIEAQLCFSSPPPHPPEEVVWHYEIVGTIGYRLEKQELIVTIFVDEKGQNNVLIVDEDRQPLVIKKPEHSALQIKLAEFIYKHWERVMGRRQ